MSGAENVAISQCDPTGSGFPLLDAEGWTQTSPADNKYNCIAWAVGENQRWWWPWCLPPVFWPDTPGEDPSLDTFARAFASLSFERCDDGRLEHGWEKIALYVHEGEVTHAARQLPTGRWTSKLGKNVDIEHTLRGLEGPLYGRVVCFMKRPTRSSTTQEHR